MSQTLIAYKKQVGDLSICHFKHWVTVFASGVRASFHQRNNGSRSDWLSHF